MLKRKGLRRLGAFVVMLLVLFAVPAQSVYAAQDDGLPSVSLFIRYHNAVVQSSRSSAIQALTIDQIEAKLESGDNYSFVYTYSNGAYLEGTMDAEEKLKTLSVVAPAEAQSNETKYVFYSVVAATQFPNGDTAYEYTREISDTLDLLGDNFYTNYGEKSDTANGVKYHVVVAEENGLAILTITPES